MIYFLVYINWNRFLLKNNGVLYENGALQIGVKSEYKNSLGKTTVRVKEVKSGLVHLCCKMT